MTDRAPQESQPIWPCPGNTAELGDEYRIRVVAWLTANGINGDDVSASFPITVAAGEIRYTRLLRNAEGRPFVDPTGEAPAVTTEVAPLLVPFEEAAAP